MPEDEMSDSRTRRIREYYRSIITPEHVEKAPRRERLKRQLWMMLSTFVSMGAVAVVVFGALTVLDAAQTSSTAGTAIALGAFAIGFALDVYVVFPWGIERFDIVLPWQFREEAAKTDE